MICVSPMAPFRERARTSPALSTRITAAFDETVTTGLQRNRTAMEIPADLLRAETAHRQAASIRYRLSAAKLPVMKDLAAFAFEGSPINEGLVRSLHDGAFLANHRNIVLVGGTEPDSCCSPRDVIGT
jgi:DNA replication protein DnaC